MIVNKKFIRSEKLGKKTRQLLAGGYTCEICLYNREGEGVLYYKHNNDRIDNIAIPFTEFSVNDEVEIEYNKLGKIYRYYNGEIPSL